MSRSVRLIAVSAIAAVIAGLLAATPAVASAHTPVKATDVRASGAHANVVPTTPAGNGYFSYPGPGYVASASITFTMPTFRCARSTDSEWLSPGIWVYHNGSLSQFAGVEFNCNGGVKFRGDVICVDGSCDDSLTINSGDRIAASLYESTAQTYALVHDLTSGTSASVTGPPASDDTVFLGDVGPTVASGGAVTKIPTYTQQIHFSKAQINGLYLTDWAPSHYNLETETVLQERSTALTGDGDAFTATFMHS